MGTHSHPDQGFGNLEADSYTAFRLKHASPEHLHRTTRRFFIGPIPEGWLNSNRKSWFKKQANQGGTRSRTATFTAAAGNAHTRALTSFEGPSAAARFGFSFPQPADVEDEGIRGSSAAASVDESSRRSTRGASIIAPVSADERQVPQILGIADSEDPTMPKKIPVPRDIGVTSFNREETRSNLSPPQASFFTAHEHLDDQLDAARSSNEGSPPYRLSSNLDSNQGRASTYTDKTGSTTNLLPAIKQAKSSRSIATQKSLLVNTPAPIDDETAVPVRTTTAVRFDLADNMVLRQDRLKKRFTERAAASRLRKSTLQEGAIMKLERMLVRVDLATQPVSDEYDENDSMKTETRQVENWREYMIVTRQSAKNESDLRLQIYKSRVIPEVDDSKAKKPRYEISLNPKTTRVNLYSSLDKTVVLWYSYKKATRIVIMRPISSAHAVEWYTFLRDCLGWARPSMLEVSVPDLNLSLRLDRPFADLEAARDNESHEALCRTMEEEQAVAGKTVKKCLEMLATDPEWEIVLDTWAQKEKMGLAWRRYDRLEWIHGTHEQKMYGSMAMHKSHELELRPKKHYETHVRTTEEPAPVEGFLVRLTTHKGSHRRLGRAYFKRMYFSTYNQFLFFSQPSKVTPPPPPRLATITGTNIPSSSTIIKATPKMFKIEPYQVVDGKLAWMDNTPVAVHGFDRQAIAESERNADNINQCDGYINLCRVTKIRKMRWGTAPLDDDMESGSDVDFHQEGRDSVQDDGKTRTLDDDRTFELLLDNGLVLRLQAYDVETMQEWIRRLRRLTRYWKLRTNEDMNTLKAVRKTNLANLNIDEEMEATTGQFAHKWEVSRATTSPYLFNLCGISSCRPITQSGLLYHKARRRSSFHATQVILANGSLMLFNATIRRRSGATQPYIHQDKTSVLDLTDCYLYSGLLTSDDLLYTNRTFDSNNPSRRALPRVYLEDGWTSIDEDAMTCFVLWRGLSKSLFRAREEAPGKEGKTTQRLRHVSSLGTPGRSIVFKCRSRAERDLWVVNVGMEIDRLQRTRGENVRLG